LQWHNTRPCGYTRGHRPWTIGVVIEFPTEPEAVRFEKYLKSGSGRAFASIGSTCPPAWALRQRAKVYSRGCPSLWRHDESRQRDARLARFRFQSTFRLPSPRRRLLADSACNAYNKCMQYTIRGIPAAVDTALRERARSAGMSLNEAAVDALAEGSGMAGSRRKRRDLGDIAKTWKAEKAVAAALADQDRVDEDLWR